VVPRRKAVAFLNYIYEETHPLLPATPRATETLSTRRRIDPAQKSAKESADSRRLSTSRQRGKAAPHKSVNLMRNAAAASHSQAEAKTTSASMGKAGARSQPIAQARAESEEEVDELNSSQDSQASQVGDLHFHAHVCILSVL
jgi:hypothetical protein